VDNNGRIFGNPEVIHFDGVSPLRTSAARIAITAGQYPEERI
jgi:hypothetical protein